MNTTLQDFDRIKDAIKTNVNDADQLTQLGIELASLGATVGEAYADSELAFDTELVKNLTPDPDGKKASVAEAERVASVSTGAEKDRLRHRSDWIVEYLNMIKLRVRYLVAEKAETPG